MKPRDVNQFLDLEAQVDDEEAEEGAEFDEDGDKDEMRKCSSRGQFAFDVAHMAHR